MFALSSKTRDEIPVHENTQFLPREIIHLVVSFLPTDISTIQQLELTCRSFYSALQPFWESLWCVQYPTITLTKNYRFASIQLHQFIQDYATPGNGTLEIKIVLVGEGAVGKSALVLRYVSEEFISRWDPTIEDSYRKNVEIKNKNYILDILDMSGPEEYRFLTEQYFKRSDGFVFCCALNSPHSLDDLEERIKLLVQVRNEDVQNIPVIISVNKSDLLEGEVTMQDVKEFAKKYGIQHIMETSAKEGTNVKELFEKICWMSAYNVHASKTYCVEQLLKNPNWIKNLENGNAIFAKQMNRPKKQKCSVM